TAAATTATYTLSLHDALPIFRPSLEHGETRGRALVRRLAPTPRHRARDRLRGGPARSGDVRGDRPRRDARAPLLPHVPPRGGPSSEEHTSELPSLAYLVCRLL